MLVVGTAARAQTIESPWMVVPQTLAAPQTPATAQWPSEKAAEKSQRRGQRRNPTPPAQVRVLPSEATVAPQVVTIIQRLSGLQLLQLWGRQTERATVEAMDPQALTNNAHATIVAGWMMPDGKTVVARLPQVAAQIEAADFQWLPEKTKPGTPEAAQAAAESAVARAAAIVSKFQPDLTVITREGRRSRARYVGLDGPTGLSIIQLVTTAPENSYEPAPLKLNEGQQIQLFAPEPATPNGEPVPGVTYVRVAKTDGKVWKLARNKSGALDRLTLRSPKLSGQLVGGIVCDSSGNNVGIVERIEGTDAHVVISDKVRAATDRVLAQQTNVPRPLLGVRGEAAGFTSKKDFLENGWNEEQFKDFVSKQVGILLTQVLPGTPAAFANLRPGDVIVKIDDDEVNSADEFSSQLLKCGSGREVKFLVRRPSSPTPLTVDVKLGGSFEPFDYQYRFDFPKIATPRTAFQKFGLQTMNLSHKMASQLGAQSGLVVVSVKPESPAAKAGLKEGDVIESIDGQAIRPGTLFKQTTGDRPKKHVVSVIRDREKKQMTIEAVEDDDDNN